MTTPAREAAYAAALDGLYSVKWPDGSPYLGIATRHARKLAEAAVDTALASLAGDLYIGDRGDGVPAVFDPSRPPGAQCIVGPEVLSHAVWALLEAALPTKERES